MQTAQLGTSRAEAHAKWREYRTALKVHKQQYLSELSSAYYQLSRGRKVLDLEESMKLAGMNAEGLPQLAITRADQRIVYLNCRALGEFYFERQSSKVRSWSQLTVIAVRGGVITSDWGKHAFKRYSAAVPLIPPQFLPKGQLDGYHILWEVETWTPEPPRDPILLKQISENLFAVMAQWDLTELERSVMRTTFTPRPRK
jgi:hypothetical protein